MMKFSCLRLLPFLLHVLPAAAQDPGVQPNVLFIFVDDLRPDLGCYGNSVVQTPNIDKLASRAVVFLNHYVQVPTCGASRFSLLTGMYPRTRAHLRNDAIEQFISPLPEGDRPETFIHHLRRNGYYTVGIGKISHSADGLLYPYTGNPAGARRELPHSWNELLFDAGTWRTGWNAFFGYADGTNRQSMGGKVNPYDDAGVYDEDYVDGLTANLAIATLKRLSEKQAPFFLGVGFFKPHLPFNAPRKYWDLYDRSKIPLTPSLHLPHDVNTASFHNSGEFNSYQSGEEHPSLAKPVSEAYARKITHAYYASISYVDAQVGKVLQALKDNDLEENTIVILWGDHGWHLGDHRVWGKHTLSERALKSPLIIKVPGPQTVAKRPTAIVSAVDVYPALMSLCKVRMPYKSDGVSFASLLENSRSKSARQEAFSYYNSGITMRTERYRITHYRRNEQPVTELYDHKNDPNENSNIAGADPKRVKRLLRELKKGNTGLYNSPGQ